LVVLGHDVGGGEELLHDLQPAGRLEVHRHAALVAVEDHERGRLALHLRLRVAPRVVAAGELLDLDHVRAHVGEEHPAGRARHDLGELDHLDSIQRTHFIFLCSANSSGNTEDTEKGMGGVVPGDWCHVE
jgi:hypothetical protein